MRSIRGFAAHIDDVYHKVPCKVMPQKTLRMNTCRIGSQNWGPNLLKIGRRKRGKDRKRG